MSFTDQDSPKRRGRIPHSAWPSIADRYKAGATLSAIAREYDCTPSAISYILRKLDESGPSGEGEGGTGPEASPTAADLTPAVDPAPAPAPAAAAPQVSREPEPIDEIEARLRKASETCVQTYRGWRQATADDAGRALADAMHELRKVIARIEIELSASRREEHAMQPIPLPLHRAALRMNNTR